MPVSAISISSMVLQRAAEGDDAIESKRRANDDNGTNQTTSNTSSNSPEVFSSRVDFGKLETLKSEQESGGKGIEPERGEEPSVVPKLEVTEDMQTIIDEFKADIEAGVVPEAEEVIAELEDLGLHPAVKGSYAESYHMEKHIVEGYQSAIDALPEGSQERMKAELEFQQFVNERRGDEAAHILDGLPEDSPSAERWQANVDWRAERSEVLEEMEALLEEQQTGPDFDTQYELLQTELKEIDKDFNSGGGGAATSSGGVASGDAEGARPISQGG